MHSQWAGKQCKRHNRHMIAMAVLTFVFAGAVEAGELESLYRSYAMEARKGADTVNLQEWSARFETACNSDTESGIEIRLRVLDELGAMYRSLGSFEKSSATYEKAFLLAEQNGHADGQVVALQNLIAVQSTCLPPSQKVIDLYDKYQEVLQNPPSTYLTRFATLLIDSYYDKGRYSMKLADAQSDEAQRREYLLQANQCLARFEDNATSATVNNKDVAAFHRADNYVTLKEPEKAIPIYEGLASDSATFAKSWMFHKALQLRYAPTSSEYQNALRGYLEGHEPDAYFPAAYQLLAMSYINTRKGALAIPILEQLIAHNDRPGNALAYDTYLLGVAYIDAGMKDRGIAILQDLKKRFPDSPSAKIAEQMINFAEKRFESAEEEMQSLLEQTRKWLDRPPSLEADANMQAGVPDTRREHFEQTSPGSRSHRQQPTSTFTPAYVVGATSVAGVVFAAFLAVGLLRRRTRR